MQHLIIIIIIISDIIWDGCVESELGILQVRDLVLPDCVAAFCTVSAAYFSSFPCRTLPYHYDTIIFTCHHLITMIQNPYPLRTWHDSWQFVPKFLSRILQLFFFYYYFMLQMGLKCPKHTLSRSTKQSLITLMRTHSEHYMFI